MAWWKLEWIKLKRTRRLLRNRVKCVDSNEIQNEVKKCTHMYAVANNTPASFSKIEEQFADKSTRYYLGLIKIDQNELEVCNKTKNNDILYGNGYFQDAMWNSTKIDIKVYNGGSKYALKELFTLVELRHPGILLLMGVTFNKSLNLVFENISIGSLYYALHVKKLIFTLEDICRIIIQLCEALNFLHQNLWLHLGLSSHAIQLISNSQSKLSSFELSKKYTDNCRMSIEDEEIQESIINWQAPEQCLGETLGQQTDIYSLCVIFQEIITGKVPWQDNKSKYLIRKLGKFISNDVELILKKGLTVQRFERKLTLDEINDFCCKHITTANYDIAENNIVQQTTNKSKFFSSKYFKKHLSACTMRQNSPEIHRKIIISDNIIKNAAHDTLQIPEEIYFDDYFDGNSKLGTHLQLSTELK